MNTRSLLGRRLLGGVAFGVVLYAAIVLWSGFDQLFEVIRRVPLWVLPAACALSFGNYALRFLKWRRYLQLLGIELDPGVSWSIYLSGFSMGITPGKMGEVLKAWLIRRVTGTPIHRSAPIVVAERFTDLLGYLILVAVGGLASAPEYQWVFWSTLAACVFAVAAAGSRRVATLATRAVSRLPYFWRLAPRVEGSFEATRILLEPRELIGPTLLSSVSWGLECLGFWLIVNSIAAAPVPFLFCVFAYALSAVAGALAILLPGGLGVTEGLLGTLLRRKLQEPGGVAAVVTLELARAQAAGAVLLARLATLWFGVLVGVVALWRFERRYGRIEVTAEESAAQAESRDAS